ncbi:COP9 signalosome complex subunit 6 [Coemansia biformis]|uniref:COP9 signalosome complex subunit 6 n=1 Tax=Coemansia biformis TaxID=1286918 RepID=A0A9W8CWV8_9FUNG|nr:COP9 signalosome complex subunit 6 [Coemansia biformis]
MAPRAQSTAVVHPLVLLNVSEHTTRTLACVKGGKAAAPRVLCGALLGRQQDARFEAFLSFELKLAGSGGDGQDEIDFEHFAIRLEQLKIIFPDDDFIGWYAVGMDTQLTAPIARLHERILARYPAALLMVFNAALGDGAGAGSSLPIAIYESHAAERVERSKLAWYRAGAAPAGADIEYFVESASDHSAALDAETTWASRLASVRVTLDSGEAERVAVEHIANVARQTSEGMLHSTAGDAVGEQADASRMAAFLTGQRNAVEMLDRDVAILKTYVGDVISGSAAFDPDVLQLVQRALSNKPVVLDDDMFDLASAQEQTDFQLASYLAAVTGAASVVRSVSHTSNTALHYARNKHAPYVSPSPADGLYGMGAGSMMSSFGGHGRLGRHRGFGGLR